MKIKEVVNIFSGCFAQTGARGDVTYLQANLFDEDGNLLDGLYPSLQLDKKIERHILKPGDVLYAAKGSRNFAVQYNDSMGLCVASSTFLIIRIKEEFKLSLKPEFILMLMNLPRNSRFLKASASGTSLPSISKKVLEELEIVIPDFETQEQMILAYSLIKREKTIRLRIAGLREEMTLQTLTNQIYQ